MTEKPLTLISLRSQNVKTLRAVRITPDGKPVFTIGGDNGAGKSSLLDSLKMSLCGGRFIPKDPIRHGQRHASVQTVLGRDGETELTIELDLSQAKAPKLVVKDKNGNAISSPQTVLNTLYESIGFDPLEFAGYPTDKKEKVIKKLAGLDFTDLDVRRDAAAERRKVANRALKDLDARLNAMPMEHRGVPEKEIPLSDLAKTMSTAIDQNAERHRVLNQQSRLDRARGEIEGAIALLEEQLQRQRDALVEAISNQTEGANAVAALPPHQELEPLQRQIEDAEGLNRKVRENRSRAELEKEIRVLETDIAKHDNELESVKEEKISAINAAKFPVPELGFDPELGLTMNGSILEEASDGQKLRLSVAIAISLSPKIGVILIKQGNLLGPDALRLVAEMAEAAGVQVLIEMVTVHPDDVSVFIEDGEITHTSSATAAE